MLSLAADPARWPQQSVWTNRIHRDDAAAFVVFLIRQVMHGQPIYDCYLVTDSCPVPQHEVLHWLAERMGRDVGKMQPLAPSGGKRLSNARMLQTGFQLRYPDYQAGYAGLIE